MPKPYYIISFKKASIMMLSLWVMAILVIFALGLGRRVSLNLRLVRYQKDSLKATYLAKAGINRAIYELSKDKDLDCDYLSESWADNEEFSAIKLNDEKEEFATVSYIDEDGKLKFGASDENAKININEASEKLLTSLFTVDEFGADAIPLKTLVQEWISRIAEPDEKKKIFKNDALKTPQELVIIFEYFYESKEKAHRLYEKIKDMITVYGGGQDMVNINTVGRNVLLIVADACAEGEEKQFVEPIVNAILELRASKEHFTKVEDIDIPVSGDDAVNLFEKLKQRFVFKSDIFTISAKGHVGEVSRQITTVYNRKENKINYWHEN